MSTNDSFKKPNFVLNEQQFLQIKYIFFPKKLILSGIYEVNIYCFVYIISMKTNESEVNVHDDYHLLCHEYLFCS